MRQAWITSLDLDKLMEEWRIIIGCATNIHRSKCFTTSMRSGVGGPSKFFHHQNRFRVENSINYYRPVVDEIFHLQFLFFYFKILDQFLPFFFQICFNWNFLPINQGLRLLLLGVSETKYWSNPLTGCAWGRTDNVPSTSASLPSDTSVRPLQPSLPIQVKLLVKLFLLTARITPLTSWSEPKIITPEIECHNNKTRSTTSYGHSLF